MASSPSAGRPIRRWRRRRADEGRSRARPAPIPPALHGNLLALQTVLERIERLSVDRVINLGDCASGPLWPAETVAFLQQTDWLHLRGNHDRLVSGSSDGVLGRSDSATWKALDAKARMWLYSLPPKLQLEGALYVHGSLDSDEAYLLDEVIGGRLRAAECDVIFRRLGSVGARAICGGHSHLPRSVELACGRVVINPGSVGWPAFRHASPPYVCETGSPHARFAVIEISKTRVAAQLRTIVYDWEQAARRAEANERFDWAYALRTGRAPEA